MHREKDTDDFAFVDNEPKTKVGDQGPEKLSPGDQIGFRSLLFVAVGGPKIFGGKSITGAVTGGTGDYAGATGSFTSPQKDNTTDTFTIWVPAD